MMAPCHRAHLATAHRLTGDLDRATALPDDLAEFADGVGNDWGGAVVDLERSCVALARDDLDGPTPSRTRR